MRTTILFLWVMILSSLAFIVFHTGHVIDQQNKRLNELNSEIGQTQRQIEVLESEWSYLSRPERIAKLAENHLDIGTPDAVQVAVLADFSERRKQFGESQKVTVSYNE